MIECTTKPEKVNSGPLWLNQSTAGYCEKACGFSVWCQPEFNPPPGLPVLSRLCSWSIASRADDERSLDASKQNHSSKKNHSCILAFFCMRVGRLVCGRTSLRGAPP